ncbi:MAG: tetratricopeptide repeat protein, partial [Chloroflexota bacterium]
WPAAVALARRSGLPAVTHDAREHLSDYLMAEMLGRLPDALQSFLVKTSVLESLEVESCRRLSGAGDDAEVAAILDELEALAVPIQRRSSSPLVAVVHPLVRNFLRSRLRTDQAEYRELCEMAGGLLAEHGQTGDAVRLLAEAKNWQALAELIEREAPDAYRSGRWQTVLTWLEALPKKERGTRPGMGLWEARILSRLGRVDEALRVIDGGLASLSKDDAGLESELEALRAASLRTRGEVAAAIEAATRAKTLAFEANVTVEVLAEARKELALALMAKGRFSDGIVELLQVLDVEMGRGETSRIAFAHGCLGSAYGALGKLTESVHHLEQARYGWGEVGNKSEICWVLNNLGMTYWQLGRNDDAEKTFVECIQRSRESGVPRAEGFALVSLGDADRMAGDSAKAAERYDEAMKIARELGEEALECYAVAGLADAKRRLGDTEAAEQLASQGLASAELRGAHLEQGICLTALGRVLRDRGQRQRAIEAFGAADRLFDGSGATREQAENLLLLADALLATRSERSSLAAALRRLPLLTASIGSTTGIRRYPNELAGICRHAIARRIEPKFYKELLAQVSGERTKPDADSLFPDVEVTALGTFDVTVGGRRVEAVEWQGEKSRELFLILLLAERPLTRDEIIASLWPDHGGTRARSVFHTTLHRAREALYREAIVESGGGYSPQPSGRFTSDVARFVQLTDTPRLGEAGDGSATREAVDLYKGPLAPGFSSEWVEEKRRFLEGRMLHALAAMADALIAKGDQRGAAAIYERMSQIDALDETACHGAMMAYRAAGDIGSGVRVFDRYRRRLQDELGQAPGETLVALYREMMEQQVARG